MRKSVKKARQVVALVIGIPLLILGLILIPLPGPGLVVCFAALFVLAHEFEWAEQHFSKVKRQLQTIIDKAKNK